MKIYLVGGAVRDEILGRPVKDRDWVVVGSSSAEMLAAGYKQVGADFPVFLHPETNEEYALARTERKSGDGYLGFTVSTENVTIEEDLARRDLTINSIAKDVDTGEYVDPFGGRLDIVAKILRHTSTAFQEDPLRVVRLARFAARYSDFTISQETLDLSRDMIRAGDLQHLSYERFWAELEKVVHEDRLILFFAYLFGWKAGRYVSFFSDVFGDLPLSEWNYTRWLDMITREIKNVPADKRMMVLTAIVAKDDMKNVKGSSSEMNKLHANIQLMQDMWGDPFSLAGKPPDVDKIYELMKTSKVWGEGPHYDNLILAVKTMQLKNVPSTANWPYLGAVQLERFRAAILEVKSEQFAPLEGKELGAAIEAARKEKIRQVLST